MANTNDSIDDIPFVTRPALQLMNYSLEMRWEFTRRHPYYLGLWRIVKQFHQEQELYQSGDDQYRLDVMAAKFGLGAIGAGGEPVPPETPFVEISGEDPSFLCGSLQPLTIRDMTGIFLTQLSP